MFLITKGSVFHSFGEATEKALPPKLEFGVSSMRSKLLLIGSSLLRILIDINSFM